MASDLTEFSCQLKKQKKERKRIHFQELEKTLPVASDPGCDLVYRKTQINSFQSKCYDS